MPAAAVIVDLAATPLLVKSLTPATTWLGIFLQVVAATALHADRSLCRIGKPRLQPDLRHHPPRNTQA